MSLGEVVRTRLFVSQMNSYDDYARAHREVFDEFRPASAILQVSRLVDPRLLVEIEADAIAGASPVASIKLAE
jgi:enamine deaminase RidA (YjgF/YER057c/UK114 family)